MAQPTKIETHLSPEQFQEFCRRVAALPGGTRVRTIRALAEEFGVSISLMAASSFRDGPLASYLAELAAKREMAEQVSAVAASGLSLGDAAASVLTQKIFDQAMSLETSDPDALDQSNALSLALSRLRLGDQRAKLLQAKIDQHEREKLEWEETRAKAKAALEEALKPAKGGITKDTLQRMEEAAKLL